MVEAGHRKRRCFDTNGACDTACMAADHESVISVIGHHKPAPAPRDPAVRRCRARCWLRARRARRWPDDAWSHHRGASRRCFRRSTLYMEPQPGPRHFTHTTPAARHSTLHTHRRATRHKPRDTLSRVHSGPLSSSHTHHHRTLACSVWYIEQSDTKRVVLPWEYIEEGVCHSVFSSVVRTFRMVSAVLSSMFSAAQVRRKNTEPSGTLCDM